jgi:heat shock protein 1/8
MDTLDFINEYMGEPDNKKKENIYLGIDLGTTNSCVCIWRNNNYEIITDENGNNTIPSYVAFNNIKRYVGLEAKNQKDINPKNVFYEVKRLIGRKIDDIGVVNELPYLTYDISGYDKSYGDKEGAIVLFEENGKRHTPEEISSIILNKLKLMSWQYLKREDIVKAVITVPAYFNDAQRQATKDAAEIAGLESVRIINEPTSAALAYGLLDKSVYKKSQEDEGINVLVYDLGGGTLDCSILTINNGVFEVRASVGNTHMGGSDFDSRIIRYSISQFKRKYEIEELDDVSVISMQRLRKACENAKKILSISVKTTIAVKDFYDGKDLYISLDQTKLIELCRDLLILCIKPMEDVLESAEMKKEDIHEIILVGGMTRMPIIRENIKKYFNGKDLNCSMNPDEVVAVGAAIQAFMLSNKEDPFSENITLLDITPLSLGIETIGGIMNPIIPRNSVIPITKKRLYTTDSDYVDSVLIKIYEGERKMTKDNFFVGEFELKGLEKLLRGIHRIEVKFRIDANGIITVSAEDLEKKNTTSITITSNKGRMNQEEIRRLVDESRDYELKDKVERNKKQLYYEIDELCSNIENNIEREEFKLLPKDKEKLITEISEINKWLKSMKYNDREENEYAEKIEILKKKYGMLVLKYNKDNENYKEKVETKIQSTTVYDDEEEEKDVFEKIEDRDLGINEMNEEEKKEIKELRNNLIELCHSIFDLLSSESINILEEDKVRLRDYVDDTLLWVYVQEKTRIKEYKIKIDEVNNECNQIVEKYNNNMFTNKTLTKTEKEELEEICYAIKSGIMCNMFSLEKSVLKSLEEKVENILEWIMENEINKEEIDLVDFYKQCSEKKKELDDVCKDLESKLLENNNNSTEDSCSGSLLSDLLS